VNPPWGILFAGAGIVASGVAVLLLYEAASFLFHFEPITVTTRREALRYPLPFIILAFLLGILMGHLFFP
jgi:hypothetical protein